MLLTIFISCGQWREKLSINKEAYAGNGLRIDGIWQTKPDKSNFKYAYFLYKDGVVLVSPSQLTLQERKERYASHDKETQKKYRDIALVWGVFNIRGKDLIIERWTADAVKYKVKKLTGTILNDTTFVITKWTGNYRGRTAADNARRDTFYYSPFYPKPDSTNVFTN